MRNFWSLSPIFLFLSLYLIGGIVLHDFYSLSVPLLLLFSIAVAIMQNKRALFSDKLQILVKGAGQPNVILMCLIFILAGGFTSLTKSLGAIDALINYGLTVLHPSIFLVGIFLMACFISLSMGTSIGTIVTMVPIAISLADATHIPLEIAVGAVISGAMFGDNLSLVSDTTIVITQTMGCSNKEKLITNLRYILPAAILTCVIYYVSSFNYDFQFTPSPGGSLLFISPYLLVLALSLLGVHVFVTLFSGLLSSILLALTQGYTFVKIMNIIGSGFTNMSDMIIITLLVGGVIAIVQDNGGLDYILKNILLRIKNKRLAETMMVATVGLVNICVANNTISLVVASPILKEIKDKYQLNAARTASLLDMTSCVVQGLIPYGIQLIMVEKLTGTASLFFIPYAYYPILMAVTIIWIIARQKTN